jgi:hypothetical protein
MGVIMSKGLEIRAQIDTENVKGLLLINGGGAVALLAFLPHVLFELDYESLTKAILWGLFIFQVGLLFAVIHNRLRRICSLIHDQHNLNPPPGKLFGFQLKQPRDCFLSVLFMWGSAAAFFLAGFLVFLGGLCVLNGS